MSNNRFPTATWVTNYNPLVFKSSSSLPCRTTKSRRARLWLATHSPTSSKIASQSSPLLPYLKSRRGRSVNSEEAIIESLNRSGVSCRIRYGRHRPEQGRVNSTAYGVDWRTCGSRVPPSRALGADALVQQNDGSTPFPGASRPIQGHVESTHMCLKHGAHATARTVDGWTPFHFAAGRGQVEFARLLLEHGADAIAQEKGGWTPLYVASKEGHPDVVHFLLECGVDPTVKTEDGSLPLHVVAARGHVEVARLLLERGTDAKARK
jgi:hypothetical protein